MPASATSLRLTRAYQDRLVGISERAQRDARNRWAAIDIAHLDADFETWRARTAASVATAQILAVRATSGYLSAFLSSELGHRTQAVSFDTRAYSGLAPDGRPISVALQSPLIGVKAALKDGQDVPASLRAGLDRAVRAVGLATSQAARNSLRDAMVADDRIVGWRRAVRGTCEACLGMATEALSPPGTPLEIHPGCGCVSEAVVRKVPDRFPRPTGAAIFAAMGKEAQDAQFGPEKAELLRNGGITLRDTVKHDRTEIGPDFITAKPLQDLQ